MADPAVPDPLGDPALRSWLAGHGAGPETIEALPGDVSPRRYGRLRLSAGGTAILATYPRELEPTCHRFQATTALLGDAGVRVPAILASDCERGWMLVEDVGERTLYDLEDRPWSALLPYFEAAVGIAARIAELPAGRVEGLNPPLDAGLLARELEQTWEVFLRPEDLLGSPRQEEALRQAFDALVNALAAEPPVPCHRDLMARNLVPIGRPAEGAAVRPGGGSLVAVLDHQDLRLGPPLYDLASLLNDSLFPPPEVEEHLLRRALGPEADRAPYHRAAAQRGLKAVGTFARFACRGVRRHLRLIPPTLGRALRHLGALPESAGLAADLRRRWARLLLD